MALNVGSLVAALPQNPSSSPGSFPVAPPFVIAEQTGDERTISLGGRSLPYRDLDFDGEQRMEVTSYPGSPVKSVQVLGAEEKETTIKGMWKDRFLSTIGPSGALDFTKTVASVDGAGVTTCVALATLFDDVRRKGQLLKMTWGPFTRLGFLRRFKFAFPYLTDCRWEATFEWISQGDPDAAAGFGQQLDQTQTQSGLGGLVAQAKGGLASLQGALATASDQVDGWLAAIDSVGSLVNQIGDTIGQVVQLADTPAIMAQRAASVYGAVVENCQALLDLIQSTPTTSVLATSVAAVTSTIVSEAKIPDDGGSATQQASSTTSRQGLAPASPLTTGAVSAAGIATAALYRRSVYAPARNMRYAAARAQVQIQAQLQAPELLAQLKAKENIDLRVVSSAYYGTPDNWRQLGIFNGVKGTSLVPKGTLLSIPRTLPSIPGFTAAGVPITTNAAPSVNG